MSTPSRARQLIDAQATSRSTAAQLRSVTLTSQALHISSLQFLVLDEADLLLSCVFSTALNTISVLFSFEHHEQCYEQCHCMAYRLFCDVFSIVVCSSFCFSSPSSSSSHSFIIILSYTICSYGYEADMQAISRCLPSMSPPTFTSRRSPHAQPHACAAVATPSSSPQR